MDYYMLQNIEADTRMRRSLGQPQADNDETE
jgi:uncharacterized protein YqfA (UPF0365 family)